MQEIKVTEEEMKALAQFADSEGQVKQRGIVKTLEQHKVASTVCDSQFEKSKTIDFDGAFRGKPN